MPFRASASSSGSRLRWPIFVAIGALVIIDAALIGVALRGGDLRQLVGLSAAAPTPLVAVDEPEPTPSLRPSAPPAAAAHQTVPATRILTALDRTTAWRATTGPCPDAAATPELSTDGGNVWMATDATADVGVTALQRMIVASGNVMTMIGSDADCAPTLVRTYVAGEEYADYPDQVASMWFVVADDSGQVHAPGGALSAPCELVAAVAPSNETNAAVLCGDGTITRTSDAGASWSPPLAVPGAQALAETADGYIVATLDPATCRGVGILSIDAEATTATPSGCLPLEIDPAALAGRIAVSDGSGTLWVWAGDALELSVDGGRTWN